MFKTKITAAALAALTLAVAMTAATSDAQAKWWKNKKFGLGFGAGVVSSLILSQALSHQYVTETCHLEEIIDQNGYIQKVKVCNEY
jgi:hypothetical protein